MGTIDNFLPEGAKDRDAEMVAKESCRILLSNLALSKPNPNPRILMVTSSVSGEGKSAIAARIAWTFAERGESVLLVDADLRRGKLHSKFGQQVGQGLADHLEGRKAATEVMEPTRLPNLSLVPRGRSNRPPGDLFAGQRFRDFLAQAGAGFDRIIIDTPPILGISESPLISRFADMVLFVVSAGMSRTSDVRDAIEALSHVESGRLAVVMNRVNVETGPYRYRYHYYSRAYHDRYRDDDRGNLTKDPVGAS